MHCFGKFDETISLFEPENINVIDSFTYTDSSEGKSLGRIPDGGQVSSEKLNPTPGSANQSPPTPTPKPSQPSLDRYQPTRALRSEGTQADFYDMSSSARIAELISEVVRQEGPISLSLAGRRVAACWGFDRMRAKAQERIRDMVPQAAVQFQSNHAGDFLWPKDLDTTNYTNFRVPHDNGDGERQAADLPLEEIGNAIIYLLEHNMGAPHDELIRETARLFGFDRLGHLVEERFRSATATLRTRGLIGLEDGTVTLSR